MSLEIIEAHRDYNIKIKLNHKTLVVFNLRNYDCHLIMQQLRKFNFEITIMPNGCERYISFNNKLAFVG